MSHARARLLSLLLLASVAIPSAARAEVFFVWPELGLGAGHTVVDDKARTTLQLDFNIGAEWDRTDVTAMGWMLHLGFADTAESRVPYSWSRVSIAPMLTLSAGYGHLSPFARVGAGPMLTLAMTDLRRGNYVGGGLQVEAAAGFKSIAEIFVTGTGTGDGNGLAFGYTAGIRLNALIVLEVLGAMDSGSHHHHRHDSYDSGSRRSRPHRSAPAGPSEHRAVPVGAR